MDEEKIVKIYDEEKNLLDVGQLLSMENGVIKIKGFNLPVLESKTQIIVEIYNSFYGIYPYLCEVSLASYSQLNARVLRSDPVIERRKSLKVKTDLSFFVYSLIRANEDITERYPNLKINLLNLSIGGTLVSANYSLKVNDILTFNFQYSKYQNIMLKAKIIRVDKVYDKKYNIITAVNYGCVFSKLPSYDEAVITKYLFDRQLKLYKDR